MTPCPNCHASIPDPAMRFCGYCGTKLGEPASVTPDAANGEAGEPPALRTKEDVQREKEERNRRTTTKVILVLWLVLPITFGCVAAANGASFWVGFIIGALVNGVIGFLLHPFGI